MDKQVVLLVELKAKEDSVEALVRETLAVIPYVLKEWACIEINLHRNSEDKTKFMLYEFWADKDFLLSDEHQKSPYLTNYFQNIEPLLAQPAKTSVWEIVSQNDGVHSQTVN